MKSEMSRKADIFHPHTLVIHPDFEALRGFLYFSLPERFEKNEGIVIHKGRNELRKMEYKAGNMLLNLSTVPFINRFVYGIFRPSKAKRSYDHAELYRNIGVGTPSTGRVSQCA